MKTRFFHLLPRFQRALGLLALAAISSGAQTNFTGLAVTGLVAQPLNLSLSDLRQMPRTKLATREKDGTEAVFEGVALAEIVKRAGPNLNRQCCSNAANTVVIIRAADGYRTLFSLPEIEPEFAGRKILVADQRDGQLIPPAQGPLRVVVPDDKVYSRWVRQVSAVEILIVGTATNAPAR